MKNALVITLAACFAATGAAQTRGGRERFTAFAVNLDASAGARTGAGVVEIVVQRWSSDAERDRLFTALAEKGPDKLLDTLQKLPRAGYIRTPNSIGYDLFYARNNVQPDGSRHIVLATNRRVAFKEAQNNTRSMQYQLTAIEIHLDKDGKGEGKMQPAAKISWDAKAKKIELENYNALPIDLVNVKSKTP